MNNILELIKEQQAVAVPRQQIRDRQERTEEQAHTHAGYQPKKSSQKSGLFCLYGTVTEVYSTGK
ncbi:hypothetical protein ACFFNY_32365 [Paenibacillus hodogayensis]|uniref:Uncharacterized protein n=1 Tax=Paenibacillus hodogayensis TaxID=279208 RepID=A0ABV5W6T6_9BACL